MKKLLLVFAIAISLVSCVKHEEPLTLPKDIAIVKKLSEHIFLVKRNQNLSIAYKKSKSCGGKIVYLETAIDNLKPISVDKDLKIEKENLSDIVNIETLALEKYKKKYFYFMHSYTSVTLSDLQYDYSFIIFQKEPSCDSTQIFFEQKHI